MLTPAQGLALTRITFGIYFLHSAFTKTTGDWLRSGDKLTQAVQHALPVAVTWYRPLLSGLVLPHAPLFARLVTLGEWGIGLSLLLGLATPLGAAVGIWLMTNYMLMKGVSGIVQSTDWLFFLGFFAFLVAAAGLAWSVDGAIRDAIRRGRVRQRTARNTRELVGASGGGSR